MKARPEAERPTPRLRAALAASVACHLALLAAPAALWRMVGPESNPADAPGRAGADFMVVSLADDPELPAPPAEAAAPAPAARPEVIAPRPREEPPAVEARELPAAEPVAGGAAAEGGGEADGSTGPVGAGGAGEDGTGGGTSARYHPPRLLAGALPLTPQESESLPSPLEIPVRLRIGPDGRVTEVEPADPALSQELRDALDRSAETMRFVPARLGGEPVEAWFTMTFIYRR